VNEKINGWVRSGVRLAAVVPLEPSAKVPTVFAPKGVVEVCCATTTLPASGVLSSHCKFAVM